VGKAAYDRLIVTRSVDLASASLLQLVGTGKVFPWIQIYVMRHTRQQVQQYLPYVGYEFQTAMLIDTDWTAGDDYVTEKLTFLVRRGCGRRTLAQQGWVVRAAGQEGVERGGQFTGYQGQRLAALTPRFPA
jgi:hypothetical protein